MKKDTSYYSSNLLIPTEFVEISNMPDKLLIVYLFIMRNKTIENYSFVNFNDIQEYCGVKTKRKTTVSYIDIYDSFEFLKKEKIIDYDADIKKVTNNDYFKLSIDVSQLKKYNKKFSAITLRGIDTIKLLSEKYKVKAEGLLRTFLFISSYIGYDLNNTKNIHCFYGTIELIRSKLDIKYDTVIKYMQILSNSENGLLIKQETYINSNKFWSPNIYVLNNKYANIEIEKSIKKLSEKYKCEIKIKQI